MSLTQTLLNGVDALPGGSWTASVLAAGAGAVIIGGLWSALNPAPAAERRYVPMLSEGRPSAAVGVAAVPALDIPLDVVPRDAERHTPYDVVGGAAIRAVVDQFYVAVTADPDLQHYFTGVDIDRLKRHQALLIGQLWGGPVAFPLKALEDAHADLNITPESYWKVVGHLMVTLTRMKVPDWICIFTMTRLYQARTLIITSGNPLDAPLTAVQPEDEEQA